MKKSITKNEYWQLVGLQTLANNYMAKVDDLENVAKEIVGELEDTGYITDMIGGDRDIDEILKILGITIDS
jgi:hypothetical protein